MALTATYNADLSRITLDATALGATATYAVFDRTLDAVTYTAVRGGQDVPVVGEVADLDDYEFPVDEAITYRVRSYNASDVLQQTFTVVITQNLDQPWLKSVSRVYLNRQVEASEASDVTHVNRSGVFPVSGRSYPVAVTDVSSIRRYDLRVTTFTDGEAEALKYMVTSGDILFFHVPSDFPALGGYFTVGDVAESRQGLPWERRWFTLPLTEVAPPGPDVIPTTYTIASMLAEYATISAVMADNATIIDLMERVGSPSEVIVP